MTRKHGQDTLVTATYMTATTMRAIHGTGVDDCGVVTARERAISIHRYYISPVRRGRDMAIMEPLSPPPLVVWKGFNGPICGIVMDGRAVGHAP